MALSARPQPLLPQGWPHTVAEASFAFPLMPLPRPKESVMSVRRLTVRFPSIFRATFRALVVLLVLASVLGGFSRRAHAQDLTILNASVPPADPTTAWVLVRNLGPGGASACQLHMDVFTPAGAFLLTRVVSVPGLAPLQMIWIPVNAQPNLLRPNRILKFHVDWNNAILEVNENNNRFTLVN